LRAFALLFVSMEKGKTIKNLVIVESPAKAKTIEKFLGKDFTVKSSYGHIRDLPKDDSAIDIKHGYKPVYIVPDDKKQVVSELKKQAKQAENIWLASDEDREGEAISWHLSEVLNLDPETTKRIVFHEITKDAISKAIANPRTINKALVDAQQARRVLDRLVGFELSPVLWKKVKGNLSAGRVQSVAVRLIVEREREINDFKSTSSFKVAAFFDIDDNGRKKTLKAELPKSFDSQEAAERFLRANENALYTIENIETKPAKKSPSAPFTTSTLQQEASRKLGYGVTQTMVIAQKLYEAGNITYMRTDSVNLSDLALGNAKNEIEKTFGPDFYQFRKYATKSASAQEAHEAIRPTYMANRFVDGDNGEKRLYDLIWKRTIASQMADAQLEKTNVTIGISTTPEKFIATGEVLKFEGFLKVYLESNDDENEEDEAGMLPPLTIGEKLKLDIITATQKFSRPQSRYTEASLVKKLEELGIGRPSTYAPTIGTIQRRGYVVKEDREGRVRNFTVLSYKNNNLKTETRQENTGAEKSKLFPSDIGNVVTDFLQKHFDRIMDYNFTATVEKEFDEIADGNMKWADMIDEFYKPFHKTVENTADTAERASGERVLGKDPATGKMVSVRVGRYGPLAQIGEEDDENKTFASLRSGQSIETITLEQALELFKLPRIAGKFEDKDMKVSIGRFGPYIAHDGKFYSLPKTEDPYTVSADRAIEIILAKREADANKLIKTFPERPDVQLLNGRWGAYLVADGVNYKLPKGTDAKSLTLQECLDIVANDKSPKRFKKAAAAKKGKSASSEAKTAKPKKKAARKKSAPKKAAVKKKSQ
jgi:DNA topoisomerase-1